MRRRLVSLRLRAGLFGAALLSSVSQSAALEGGLAYPLGGVDNNAAVLPPPGFYSFNTATYSVSADRKDGAGNKAVDFKEFGYPSISMALAKVWDARVFGGSVVSVFVVPTFENARVDINDFLVPGFRKARTGFGQLVIEPFTWSKPFQLGPSTTLFVLFGGAVDLPTNRYDPKLLANVGPAAGAVRGISALTLKFGEGWDLSERLQYVTATGDDGNYNCFPLCHKYHDGDAMTFEYGFTKQIGQWGLGVNGYVTWQVEDDRIDGISTKGTRNFAQAIGPMISYTFLQDGKPFSTVYLKYHHEFENYNTPQIDKWGIKFGFPIP